jgi:hypothetical protein
VRDFALLPTTDEAQPEPGTRRTTCSDNADSEGHVHLERSRIEQTIVAETPGRARLDGEEEDPLSQDTERRADASLRGERAAVLSQ